MILRLLWSAFVASVALLANLQPTLAAGSGSGSPTRWVTTVDANGKTIYLEDNRKPALYTGNFGDCLGKSAINVTRFDAAYYKDNMTVLFHLTGDTGLRNESLMMYIGVYAYGENRFDLTFNPCNANIASLCPVNSSVPIEANGIIPIAASDVASIMDIALSIPDFEGEAILRIFANSTQTEIGCYSAVITNGATFSQPAAVGTVLGIFALIAMIASFATAVYGDSVTVMRKHYAHSLSVLVVFAVYQHIFFTGALSMNWPSVLVAWWSNFAWAGGMINSATMQASINHLIGNNVGNTSQVGAAASGSAQESLGGGYNIHSIYKRGRGVYSHGDLGRDLVREIYQRDYSKVLKRDVVARGLERSLQRRNLANSTTGYTWYGSPVGAGLPLPGNYSGFAGTLAQEGIRVSNAFMTGFLWFLILLVLVASAVVAFKWTLELFSMTKLMKRDRLRYFRQHWAGYTALATLRTLFIGFFMMMLLSMFQFSYSSSGGVKAVAAIVFIVTLVGVAGAAIYACLYRIRHNNSESGSGHWEKKTVMKVIPWYMYVVPTNSTTNETKGGRRSIWRSSRGSGDSQSVHEDEDYTKKFGWLAARFRNTRWWFFIAWLFYEFVRACFYAGASGHPMTQVFGLLVVETLAFATIVWLRPFEGKRLNLLVVYLLGFSKVASVALSAAFDVNFNLPRITTTVIGIVIIVIQGVLTIATLIAIVVGAISSYMSVTRHREDFRPRKWTGMREKYLRHVDDTGRAQFLPPAPIDTEPKEHYFSVTGVRRMAKIEDEDAHLAAETTTYTDHDPSASYVSLGQPSHPPNQSHTSVNHVASPTGYPTSTRAPSRAASISSMSQSNLPFGARQHKPSWSSRDLSEFEERQGTATPTNMPRTAPDEESAATPTRGTTTVGGAATPKRTSFHARTPSRSVTMPSQKPGPLSKRSMDDIKFGGDVSTPDTIGKVPNPIVRPRSGTLDGRSRVGSPLGGRNGTPVQSMYLEGGLNLPTVWDRGPLTPAEELDEELVRRVSKIAP
ncbi:hypothetical protein LTR66_013254 [Elasticomyces elasticus]|nr:hypothetical protein LTR66_013254 [Elasticomyces elasticus]